MASPGTSFISYSRSDADFVLRLSQDLRKAGASIWLDQFDIRPGEDWDRAIGQALAASSQMILVLSPASVASDNVLDEVGYALTKNKPIVPVLLKDCEIPYRLSRMQYVDFRESYERGLETLTSALSTPMRGQESRPNTAAMPSTTSANPNEKNTRLRFIAAGAVVTLAIGLMWAWFAQRAPEVQSNPGASAASSVPAPQDAAKATSAPSSAVAPPIASTATSPAIPFKDAYRAALQKYIAAAPAGFKALGAQEFTDWKPTVSLPNAVECLGSGYPSEPVIECVVYRVRSEIDALRKFEELIELTQATWPGSKAERMNLFWAGVSKEGVPVLVSFNAYKISDHHDVVVSVRPRR